MRLTEGHKRILRYAGYPLLALITFVCAAWASFDAERLRQKAVSVLGKNYDVSIESIEKSIIPGNFTAHGIVFKTRPTQPEEKPTIVVVDELEANIGLLSLIGGTLSVDIDAVLGGGTIDGNISISKEELEIEMSTQQLDVGAMPGLKVLFAGLPVTGGLDGRIDLTLPRGEKGGYSMAKANGKVALACPSCAVGPGKVVPKMQAGRRSNAFAKEGVTLPKLSLGDNKVTLSFVDGRGTFDDFQAVSADGEIYAEGFIDFASPIGNSEFHHCYRFKFSDKAKKKDAKLEGMERGMERARRTDGYIGMRMTGTFERPKRIGSRSCQPGETPADIKRKRDRERRKQQLERERERQAERETPPTLTGTPDTPTSDEPPTPIKVDNGSEDTSGNGRPEIPPPRTSGPAMTPDSARRTDDVKVGDDDDDDGAEVEPEGDSEEGAHNDNGQDEGDQGEEGEGAEGEGEEAPEEQEPPPGPRPYPQ